MENILELQKMESTTEDTTNAWSTFSIMNCQNGNGSGR